MSQSLNHPKTTGLDLCWCFACQGHLCLNLAWEWCSVGVGDESNAPLATGGVKLKGWGRAAEHADTMPAAPEGEPSASTATDFPRESRNLDFYMKSPKQLNTNFKN